jgi:hypothetical protein
VFGAVNCAAQPIIDIPVRGFSDFSSLRTNHTTVACPFMGPCPLARPYVHEFAVTSRGGRGCKKD